MPKKLKPIKRIIAKHTTSYDTNSIKLKGYNRMCLKCKMVRNLFKKVLTLEKQGSELMLEKAK